MSTRKPLTTATQSGKPAQAPTPDASDGGALPAQPGPIRHRKASGKFKPAPSHKP
jgi:hypothetical protein